MKEVLTKLSLIILDSIAFYLTLLLVFVTYNFFYKIFPHIINPELKITFLLQYWWTLIVIIFFIAYENLYTKRLPFWDETKQIIKALTLSIIVISAVITIAHFKSNTPLLVIILFWIYGTFIFPIVRLWGKKLLYKIGVWKENVIILGAGEAGIKSAEVINKDKFLGYNLIGFLDDYKVKDKIIIDNKEYKVYGSLKNCKKYKNLLNISTVIVSIPSLPPKKLTQLTNNIQKHAKRILVVPDLQGLPLLNTELLHLFEDQVFFLRINNNLKLKHNILFKTIFDYTVTLAFIPLMFPLILLIGILIKIDSPGPIFYTHERIGKNGKKIKVIKFRSMYQDSQERLNKILEIDLEAKKEWEKYFKLKDDPRITTVGKFLRKTSLDELPQIFNVLKGEMSLVGPRPVLQEEIDNYYKEFADYYYMVKPGITGLWQVSGRSNTSYDFRVKLDTWYVLNWSLWLDIVILFKTLRAVFKGEGAY